MSLGNEREFINYLQAKEMPKCPACGAEIDKLYYTEYGTKRWVNGKWSEDDCAGDAEYLCPECNCELDYGELEALGVV